MKQINKLDLAIKCAGLILPVIGPFFLGITIAKKLDEKYQISSASEFILMYIIGFSLSILQIELILKCLG